MKIFNWVHQKFNNNILKDGFARNVKKTESIAIYANTKALLEQVALVDVLDGWRDGILTIGTCGFDPLKKSNGQQKENFIFESEEDEGNDVHDVVKNDDDDDEEDNNVSAEEEEVNPLIFSTSEYKGNDEIMTLDGVPLFDNDATGSGQGEKRRRTTLADLFNEDSENKKKPNPNEFEPNVGKKQSAICKKNDRSFAKKLIPQVKEDSHPITKFHQMMRRMKRKIHPEIEGKANKSDVQDKTRILELLGKKRETGESVSLLQVQDATAV